MYVPLNVKNQWAVQSVDGIWVHFGWDANKTQS